MEPESYATATKRQPTPATVPPAAIEYEAAVVAACLCDVQACGIARTYMDASDCYDERHRLALQAAWATVDATGQADVLATAERLREAGHADVVTLFFLARLAEGVGTTAAIGTYARKIRQCRIMREVLVATHKLQAEGYDPRCDPEALADLWSNLHRRIESMRVAKRQADDANGPSLSDQWSDLYDRLERGEGDAPPTPLGLRQLDRLLKGGPKPGQLIVVAGRPGEGKTTLALVAARHAAQTLGRRVLFVSLEMEARELRCKLASMVCGFDVTAADTMQQKAARQQAFAAASEWNITINDRDSQNMETIAQWCKDADEAGRCGLVIVDNMQEIVHNPRNPQHIEIGQCARACKQLAKRLEVPVILLAQASRDIESRGDDATYRKSDVADSKGIEAAADVVLFTWRPRPGDTRFPNGYRELQVVKNRSGEEGVVRVDFDGAAASVTESHDYPITRGQLVESPRLRSLQGGKRKLTRNFTDTTDERH